MTAAAGSLPGSPSRVQACGALLAYSALMLLPDVLACFFGTFDAWNYAWQKLSYALALWIAWLAVFGNIWLACVLAAPFLLLVPLESYLLVRYQSPLLPHILGILGETDFAEARDHMRGLWGLALLSYGATALIAYACLTILRRAGLRWRHRSRLWTLASLLVAGVAIHAVYQYQETGYDLLAWPDELRVPLPPFLLERVEETSPFGIPLRVRTYREFEANIEQQRARLKDWRFGASQSPQAQASEAFVLVIGETGRADRWSLNGYQRATSPRLAATPNLVSFPDFVSVSSATRRAVPAILARKPYYVASPERSIVSAFHEAGFKTYWFSLQAATGYHDAPATIYAREADTLKFLNFSTYAYRAPFDEVLLAELERALAEAPARKFIVLHTLGSHFDYAHRYPPEFEVFRPAVGGSLHDPATRAILDNAYDNSILYTDHFLAEAIRTIGERGPPVAAMLYVADHGESLFEPGCPAGHSMATRENFRVAAFFWHSQGYARAFPEKLARLRSNRDRKLSTENVFATLLDAASIRFPGEDLSRSLMSERFAEKPRLVTGMGQTFDYDRAHVGADCQLAD